MFNARWYLGISILMFSCALFLFSAEESSAKEDEAHKRAIVRSLESMEYERVLVLDCMISFSRRVAPTKENGGYFAYTRFVNLRNIENIGDLSVREFKLENYNYETFELRANLRDSIELRRLPVIFKAWVIDKFGADLWPYVHPKFHDENTQEVEYYLQTYHSFFKNWNRRVDYSSYGSATVFSGFFSLNFERSEPLEAFSAAVIGYSHEKGCSE